MFALAVAAITSSCNTNDDPTPQPIIYTDIVTVEEIDDGKAVFTFREKGDSPLITLTSTQTMNKELFKEKTRIAISYTPSSGQHYIDDAVTLRAAVNVIGEGKSVDVSTKDDTRDWLTSQINMYTISRSGEYIDIVFVAYTSPDASVCRLVADEGTLDNEYPVLHLLFEPSNGANQDNYAIYMSYSLADIFSRPMCKGVKVYFADATNPRLSPVTLDRPMFNSTLTPDTEN